MLNTTRIIIAFLGDCWGTDIWSQFLGTPCCSFSPSWEQTPCTRKGTHGYSYTSIKLMYLFGNIANHQTSPFTLASLLSTTASTLQLKKLSQEWKLLCGNLWSKYGDKSHETTHQTSSLEHTDVPRLTSCDTFQSHFMWEELSFSNRTTIPRDQSSRTTLTNSHLSVTAFSWGHDGGGALAEAAAKEHQLPALRNHWRRSRAHSAAATSPANSWAAAQHRKRKSQILSLIGSENTSRHQLALPS